MRYLTTILTAVIFLSGCKSTEIIGPPIVPDEDWPTPYIDSGTLGAALESEFESVLEDCGITKLDSYKDRTSIPRNIRVALELEQKVITEERDAVERILRYMFPKPEFSSYNLGGGVTRRELRGSSLNIGKLPTPISLSSNILYYQNCSTILAAALEVGLNTPLTSIQSGAKASIEEKAGLGLVDGTFRSPLSLGLLKSAPFSTQIPLLLDVWKWYLDNPDEVDKSNYYIDQFVGVAQIDYRESETQHSYSLDADGNTRLGPVSIGFRGNFESGIGTMLDSKGFSTHIYLKEDLSENITFESLPSPDRIAETINSIDVRLDNQSANVLQYGINHSLSFTAAQLPREFCEPSVWENETSGLPGILSRRSIEWQEITNTEGVCVFFFDYRPNDEVFDDEELFEGEFEIRTSSSYSLNERQLSLSFPVRLPTTNDPRLVPVGSSPEWVGTSSDIMWKIPIQVISTTPGIGEVVPSTLQNQRLQCRSGATRQVDYDIIEGENLLFTLNLTTPRPRNLDGREDGTGPIEVCEFSALALMPVADDIQPIRRPITVSVPLPVVSEDITVDIFSLLASIPEEGNLEIGSNVEGSIDLDDVVLPDGSRAQSWLFEPTEDASVSVHLSSEEFDPYLIVLTPDNEILDNDDMSEDTLDSEINLNIVTGVRYRIITKTLFSERSGSYTLSIRRNEL